jgi:hypothetical protein
VGENPAVVTELVGDRYPEFTHTHDSTVATRAPRCWREGGQKNAPASFERSRGVPLLKT